MTEMFSKLRIGSLHLMLYDQYHLSAHEELLYVVPLASGLAQLVGGGVSIFVGIGVLPLELHQGDLQPLHHLTNERHLS